MDRKRLGEYVLGLYVAMLRDVAIEYPVLQADFERDYKRLSSAIDTHGVQFALITMPDYRKHLDKCLDNGLLTPSHMVHFGSWKKVSPVPRLFKGLMLRVFDDNGVLRSSPDVRSIFWLRQLLGAVRKLKVDCDDSAIWKQTNEFFKTDAGVRSPSLDWDNPTHAGNSVRDHSLCDLAESPAFEGGSLWASDDSQPIRVDAGILASIQGSADILVSLLGRFEPSEWAARHGPGAVADHNGSYKYEFKHWPAKLESVFPYDYYGVSSHSSLADMDPVSQLDHSFCHEPAARLISVPKSLKGPRLIAAEPTSHQWCQQIIRDFLMTRTHQTLLGAFVNFRRQDLSQDMVRRASIDGLLSTADLSEASDRLSCYVVERVFRTTPSTLSAFMAVRTRWMTQTLDRFLPPAVRLRKFSTMGSALTFPVQSIVFAAIAIGCTLYTQGLQPSINNIRKLKGQVRVFGDDIIIPTHSLGLLGNSLAALGLKINDAKTFGAGKFRESCGEDAYAGTTVTTLGVNEFPRKSAPGAVMSCVDVHNNLLNGGLVETARYIRTTVGSLGYKFPKVAPASGALGWHSFDGADFTGLKTRYNQLLQRSEVRIHTASAVVDRVPPRGYAGVLQFFTEAVQVVTSRVSSLGYNASRPKSKLTLRWAAQSSCV